jgi:hypothetical protein
MAAKLKTKRTSITTMRAKIQAFDIFQTPLNFHYPLPLRRICISYKRVIILKYSNAFYLVLDSGSWLEGPSMIVPRSYHTLTTVGNILGKWYK